MTGVAPVLARMLVALGAVVGVGAMWTSRVLYEGERELRTAEALTSANKLEEASVHARAAAAWYVPAAPHVPAAYARLIAIARLAEGRGDPAAALYAWRSLRAAALSSRWATIPYAEQLALADASIARLAATQPQPSYARTQEAAELQQQQHVLLAQRHGLRLPWVFMLLLGFAALCAGLAHMGLRGFDREAGRFQLRRLRFGAVLAAGGVAAWALALYFA